MSENNVLFDEGFCIARQNKQELKPKYYNMTRVNQIMCLIIYTSTFRFALSLLQTSSETQFHEMYFHFEQLGNLDELQDSCDSRRR